MQTEGYDTSGRIKSHIDPMTKTTQNFRKYIGCLAGYYISVLVIFLFIQKPIFLIYNQSFLPPEFNAGDLWQIYLHGLRLDIATAAYLTAVPLLLVIAGQFSSRLKVFKIWKIYNAIVALLLAVITVVDASLYEFWEFKLDSTVLMYINDPKNAAASVSGWYIALRVLWIVVMTIVYLLIMWLPLRKEKLQKAFPTTRDRLIHTGVLVLVGGVLFAAIRGIDVWPNNPGAAYYTKTLFYNHSALNPAFNCIYSMTRTQNFADQFQTIDNDLAVEVMKEMYPPTAANDTTLMIIDRERPNILFVILEGMGACFIGNLGGDSVVAPNISRITEESVNFTRAYCSSFRTDRGVVSALSGYPGQPNTSIMRYTNKVQNLPGMPRTLRDKGGYSTRVLYASDASFFNMSGYFLTNGHEEMVTQDDFPAEQRSTKWGVPDHLAFEWLYDKLQEEDADKSKPHYNTILTISSHTPFDVPYHRLEDEKKNSFAYTDSCFGAFYEKLKTSPAWDNLMIVVTADHGFNHEPIASPNFAHVPLFVTGGAVPKHFDVEAITGQTDIPAIVIAQLGLPYEDFTFSRNTLSSGYKDQWAINSFGEGFTFFDERGATVYLSQPQKATFGTDSLRELRGKAFWQMLYQDLDKR